MTWQEKTIARILLVIAKMICHDEQLERELERLRTEIQVNAPKAQ